MNQNEYNAVMRRVAPSDGLLRDTLNQMKSLPKRRASYGRWIAVGTAAACFAAAVTAAVLLPQRPNPGVVAGPLFSSDGSLTTSSPTSDALEASSSAVLPSQPEEKPSSGADVAEPTPPASVSSSRGESIRESSAERLPVTRLGLTVNELAKETDACRRYYNPAEYDYVTWSMEQFIQHWGQPIRLSSIPGDLTEYQPGHGGEVILSKEDGKPVYDTYGFTFADDFDYEGYRPLRREVRVRVSAVGTSRDSLYLTDEPEPSLLHGVEVIFGHRKMDYGPYDEQDHTPAGYYDLYAAYFTLHGLDYELITENLSLEETELILLSLLENN